jgi:hypothetical protein
MRGMGRLPASQPGPTSNPPLQAPSTKNTPGLHTVTGNFTAGLSPSLVRAMQATSVVPTGNTPVTPGL